MSVIINDFEVITENVPSPNDEATTPSTSDEKAGLSPDDVRSAHRHHVRRMRRVHAH